MPMPNTPYLGWFIGAAVWALIAWAWSQSAFGDAELIWLPSMLSVLHAARGLFILFRTNKVA